MFCETCLSWTGRNVQHPVSNITNRDGTVIQVSECELRQSLTCRRCCKSGHSTGECTYDNTIHPSCIEELIPNDIREYYGINSHTEYIPPEVPILVHDVRWVEIVNQDKWIRKFMKNQSIPTARKCEENIIKIMDWAAGCGLKIRILTQES